MDLKVKGDTVPLKKGKSEKVDKPGTFAPHSPAFHMPTGTEVVVLESDDVVAKVIDVEDTIPRPFNVRTQDLEAI